MGFGAENKSHKRSHADEKDIKILEISLKNPEISDEEIGNAVGLVREAVGRRKQRPGYQALLQKSLESTQSELGRIFNKALSELDMLLDDPDPRIRMTAVSLALKFMPETPSSAVRVESLAELVDQPNFFDELLKIPGVGHKLVVGIIKPISNLK